jgi:hypothetical protein
MNIAVSLPPYSETGSNPVGRFIVETSFFLIREHSDHKFIIIIDKTSPLPPLLYSNTETILVKPLSKNALLKKIWWGYKTAGDIKKSKG